MSKEHIVCRIIDGVRYWCKDVGCSDFDRAEYNRYIVAHNLFTSFWIQMETAIVHTPANQPLASWIPRGLLPQVGKAKSREIRQQFGGGEKELYEGFGFTVVGS